MTESEFNGLLTLQMENPDSRVALGPNGEAIVDPNKEPLPDDVWARMAEEIASERRARAKGFGQDVLPVLVGRGAA